MRERIRQLFRTMAGMFPSCRQPRVLGLSRLTGRWPLIGADSAPRISRQYGIHDRGLPWGITPDASDLTTQAAQAADEIFAPRHGEEDYIQIREINGSEPMLHESELWEREHNSMRVTHRRSLVSTCSGAVVDPRQIRCVCGHCGKYDDVLYRCDCCGIALCHLHARLLGLPDSSMILCPRDYKRAVRSFDVWAANDCANAAGQMGPIYPGTSCSATAMTRRTGE